MLVRFVKHNLPYQAGEEASFEEAMAQELIAKGIAVDSGAVAEQPALGAPVVDGAPRKATIEELEADVIKAGYAPEAAKSIAQRRFDGEHGECSKYVGNAPLEAVRADLADMTKAEIVKHALDVYQVELNEGNKKDELVEAVIAARAAKATSAEAAS